MKALRSNLRNLLFSCATFGLAIGTFTCGGTGTSTNPNEPNNDGGTPSAIDHLYTKSTTALNIEIDYQTGAEPYTGTLMLGTTSMDTWNLFRTNVVALFNNQKTINVPNMLSQMEALSDISGSSFTVQQILDIATKHRHTVDANGSSGFYFVFLNGLFNDGMMARNDVLGVSIGTTEVIAMFKPVIASSSSRANIREFVEQSTLIHEFGHAAGLVNNGVAMVTPHQDTANGAHDSNSKCVMYYANEGAAAASQFVQQTIITGSEVLFDSNCLADISARMAAAK